MLNQLPSTENQISLRAKEFQASETRLYREFFLSVFDDFLKFLKHHRCELLLKIINYEQYLILKNEKKSLVLLTFNKFHSISKLRFWVGSNSLQYRRSVIYMCDTYVTFYIMNGNAICYTMSTYKNMQLHFCVIHRHNYSKGVKGTYG